jgi:hypothetical protein
MSNPRKNVWKKITNRIQLDDKDFDNLAHPIGKKLSKDQRSKVVEALNNYDRNTRLSQSIEETKQDRKALEKIAKTLKDTIAALRTLKDESTLHGALFWRTGIKPEEEMSRLESLEAEARDLRKRAGKRGRKRYDSIHALLFDLEEVFVDAGGGTTGVTREVSGITRGNPRKSHFIDDFVWPLLQHVPKDTPRPYAPPALAAKWEELRANRPVGDDLLWLKL